MAKSNFSNPIFSISTPSPPEGFNSKFIYNFYTADESVQEESQIPDTYKKSTLQKSDVNLATFSLRVPRYIELNWQAPSTEKLSSGNIKDNLSKIATHDSIISSKHIPYLFSSYDSLDQAYEDIKKNADGDLLTSNALSQATITEAYVNELMKGYEESPEKPKNDLIKKQIKESISSIEKFSDSPEKTIGYKFYDSNNNKIENSSALDKIAQQDVKFYSQINSSIAVDVFFSASISNDTLDKINELSKNLKQKGEEEIFLAPVYINDEESKEIFDASSLEIIGYIIEKFKFENNAYTKESTIVVENAATTNILDVNVKYGATYHYVLRTVGKFILPTVYEDKSIKNCTYYISGNPITAHVTCVEDVAPPPPTDISFVWDYKNSNFYVTWQMPFNPQRDIKQFQVFRRKSIYEPFELLEQQCFDFSQVKMMTGEIVDGNKQDMTKENINVVKYLKNSTLSYQDKEFKIDTELMKTSKYIYCIASIDAHGLISNYSAQFEVSFDFFKNSLVKKLISNAGAPRPYPNMMLNTDLFKDTIQTSGMSSKKLKIYFMPEYFKVYYNSKQVQKIITTNQDGLGGYYKLQFINTQNQKSDSLKIRIDDPNGLSQI